MRVIKAPSNYKLKGETTIFLAGSIEQGKAENWQEYVTGLFTNTDFVILNPRRDDWDDTWEQKEENREFRKQVKWELKALGNANHIIFYFQPGTQSPISLLELGAFADSYNCYVVCPEGYYRKGNVDIFCEHRELSMYKTLEEAVTAIKDFEDEN